MDCLDSFASPGCSGVQVGALAGVVVSSGCRAVLGSPPDCVSLAPAARRPRTLLLQPSGFGRYSANKSERRNEFLLTFITHLPAIITESGFLSALQELQLTCETFCPTLSFYVL